LRAFWWDFGVEMEPDSIRKMNEANGAFAPCQGRNTYRHNMPDNERRDCRLIVGANEESLVVLMDDGRLVEMERRLIVNGNPPEFFDLMAEVLAVEEINHPLHAHKTAFQQKELAPLFVVQLHYIKRGSCGGVISKSDG
jgi:hypothetical protein